jgi:predicted amidohydrolase
VSQTLTVAVVQMSSGGDVRANLEHVTHAIRGAAAAGAQLVAFPENMGYQAGERDKLQHALPVASHPFLDPVRALARELGVAVLAGSIPEKGPDPEHVYNTSVLIGRKGETVASYRKIHLFDVDFAGLVLRESAHVTPGEGTVVAELDGWKIGLTVCYDLRFPELYRRLSRQGAEIITIPAAFTLHTGKDHWEVLVRARAIENQAFVLAPGQWGKCGPGRVSWGKSMIVDPWGAVLACAPERVGWVMATLDRDDLVRVRGELPALEHRRPDASF